MISVYPSNETEFIDNGIKILHPLKALIRKEDNGEFYIELKDKIENIEYYQEGLIIRTDTPWGKQGFRLTNPTIDNDRISCKAKHLYFDTSRYVIVDSYVVDKNCNDTLDHLNNACDKKTPFSFISDITSINSYRCVRNSLEEAISTVIDRWGGHLVRDNFNIEIRASIGQDRGVVLSYKKNIKKIKAKETWDEVVTKLMPVGKDGLLLPDKWIEETDIYDIPYTKVVNFEQSEVVEEDYMIDGVLDEESYKNALLNDLKVKAEKYLIENKVPKVNYTLSANIDNVSDIGDIIYVKHPKCNIDITTNVIALEYDCILEKYTKIEFGNFKNKLSNLINDVTASITKDVKKENLDNFTKLKGALEEATNKINSAMNDSYVIYDGSQILIVDTLPKENAKNVIRVNSGGIGFSQNGINDTFRSAWTIDGTLDMQNINVINLVADLIKGGTLKLGGKNNSNGVIEVYDADGNVILKIDKNGLEYEVINDLTKKVDEQAKSITNLDYLIKSTKSSSSIEIKDAFEGNPVEFSFYGDMHYTYLGENTYLSENLFLYDSYLVIEYEDSFEKIKLPYFELNYKEQLYDEFKIIGTKAYIIRRLDDNKLPLESETIYELGNISISLKNDYNKLYMEDFDLNYVIKYNVQNNYSKELAALKITTNEINLAVSEKANAEETNSMITQASNQISSMVSDINTIQQAITTVKSAMFSHTSETFEMLFKKTGVVDTITNVENVLKNIEEYQNITSEYIRFEGAKIVLGKSSSPVKLIIENDVIKFVNGDEDNPSAYISENQLYITDSTILNKLQIGYWETKPDSKGNLNTRWVGGN